MLYFKKSRYVIHVLYFDYKTVGLLSCPTNERSDQQSDGKNI